MDKEDWHAGDQSKSIEIRLDCILDDDQIKRIIEILELPLTVISFREIFTGKLIYHYEYEIRKTWSQLSLFFKLGELTIEKKSGATTGWIGEIDRNASYTGDNWPNIVSKIKSQKSENLMLIIKESLKEIQNKQSGLAARIYFAPDFADSLLKLLKQSIIVIEEFREKPQKALVEFRTSPTGRELASVLFNLKNGRPQEKEKLEQIRQKFHSLFPILELDVIRENNEIKILIQKAGIESTTFYLGAGILETLLLLTHLIAHKDKVICVDHPELHLHPHAQRGLGSFIEGSKDGQILVSIAV